MSDRIKKLMSEGRSRIQNKTAALPELPRDPDSSEKSDNNGASFIARDIPEWKRESLRMVLSSKMTPEDLGLLAGLSEKQKYLLTSLKNMDACDVETLSRLVKDKSGLRAKLTFLSAWSNISKNGPFQKGVGKVGGLLNKMNILSRFC